MKRAMNGWLATTFLNASRSEMVTRLTRYKVANYVLFQLGWLACVWGAAAGYPWLGLVVFVPTLLLNLGWTKNSLTELKLLDVCAVSGIAFNGILLATVAQRLNGFGPRNLPEFFVAEKLKNGETQHG